MSSDFEGYEQDFAVLTAEITSKIGRVPKLSAGPVLVEMADVLNKGYDSKYGNKRSKIG